ncbi:cache domain-containing sensor histidine kinase [Paenibacillus thalictri]|uniref:Sensor histidine kinase n=1 Tax=Paenibacillus thalictri TaxID=2527873 RepID=A0A4Q9DQB1_9BACL|nr:sensor histidine kinase [Paenibacillus thalictri]TBL76266.1 sensor histidine kinase [Paenibacillus thalictri]
MQRVRRYWQKLSFWKTSLVWSVTMGYLLMTALPFAASYFITATYWWSTSKEASIRHSEQILRFTKDMFDAQLQQMEKLSGLLYSNNSLLSALELNPQLLMEQQTIEINQAFDKLFYDMSYSRSDVLNFYYFNLDGSLRYRNGDPINYFKYQVPNSQFDEWFEHTRAADGKTVLISKPLPFHDESKPVFSIARLIKLAPSPIGIVLIDFNFQVLQSIIGKSAVEKSRFIVSDFDGHIITQNTDKTAVSDMLEPEVQYYVAGNLAGSRTMDINGRSYLVIYDTFERYSIKLIHLIPTDSLISQNMAYMLRMNSIIAAAMCVFIGLSIYYFRRRVQPLRELARVMPGSIREPFDERVQVLRQDEIGQLGRSFNRMMERLQELFQLDFKHKLDKAKAEKALLEAQINPHFLYNTLDTIRFKALEQGNGEVADMLYALSINLRYTIANTNTKVTVREEVEWLERYLYLQKLRFGSRFEVFFQIDVSVYEMKIYRLILQPFIENAILHGFQKTRRGGLLHINGYWDKSAQRLTFEIVDNGCGFDYLIDEYVDDESVKRLSRDRIGMHNALRRLFLYYGSQCQAYIHSVPGKRTAIKMMIDIDEVTDDAFTAH